MYSDFYMQIIDLGREGTTINNYIISHILFISMVKGYQWTHLIVYWLKIFL